ncbi:MAG: 1,4-dihydroxy-6-naphthoate synthase [Saprospiraceae bacterium]
MNEFKDKINLAISPCPNDTFIFGAWIKGLLGKEKSSFLIPELKVDYLDIQELNNSSKSLKYDLIKVSAAWTPYLLDHYDILSTGGALGDHCGPLLIARSQLSKDQLIGKKIAIPGQHTSAHFLFKFAFPNLKNTCNMLFSEIEDAILREQVDAGVIIHENRFTYKNKGLHLIKDLGSYWSEQTNLPIPLGLIMIRKTLPAELKTAIKEVILSSIHFAENNFNLLMPFIRSHSQEMEEEVIQQHITLYVNEFSKDLGVRGKEACQRLFMEVEPKTSFKDIIFI